MKPTDTTELPLAVLTKAHRDQVIERGLRFLSDRWGRKLDDWKDAPTVTEEELGRWGSIDARMSLPMYRTDAVYGKDTLGETTPALTPFLELTRVPQIFLLVEFPGQEYRRLFFIDTQGYNYARYVLRVI